MLDRRAFLIGMLASTVSDKAISRSNLSGTAYHLDQKHMEKALSQIQNSNKTIGFPIGAILVHKNEAIAEEHNKIFSTNDPTQHAEIRAINSAIKKFGLRGDYNYIRESLRESTIYTTLEPCPMCAGTMTMLRIKKVVICMSDEKWGAMGTVDRLSGFPRQVESEFSEHPYCIKHRNDDFQSDQVRQMLWRDSEKFKP